MSARRVHEGAEMWGFYGDGWENLECTPPVAVVRPEKGVGDGAIDGEVSNVWEGFQETECPRMEHQRAHGGNDGRTRWPRIVFGCVGGEVRQHQNLHRVQIWQ
jgi:hypothetical protein